MAKRVRAKVRPEILSWARTSAGFAEDTAAKKLNVKPELLLAWESKENNLYPTITQLRNMARVYKRPLAVFYLQEIPLGFKVMRDFRRLPSTGLRFYSPELTLEIRSAQQRRELALELFQDIDDLPGEFDLSASIDEDPEAIGERIRHTLGITHDLQRTWRDPRVGFNTWRERIEALGVLVFQMTSVERDEVSGFAFHEALLPVIAINKNDVFSRRAFGLLHEFTHLLVGEPGVSDLDVDERRPPEDHRIEMFCNRVASAALMPQTRFLNEPIAAAPHGAEDWSDDEISELASVFSVSRVAVVRRLLTFDRTTARFYRRKHEQYQREYLERKDRERNRLRESDREFRTNPPRDTVNAMGKPFVRAVLTNYYRDRLTLSDVSRHLGLRVKHMPRLEQFVGFG